MSTRDLTSAGAFVIVGGAGGIGSAIARNLSADGARLVRAGRRAEPLEALAASRAS